MVIPHERPITPRDGKRVPALRVVAELVLTGPSRNLTRLHPLVFVGLIIFFFHQCIAPDEFHRCYQRLSFSAEILKKL